MIFLHVRSIWCYYIYMSYIHISPVSHTTQISFEQCRPFANIKDQRSLVCKKRRSIMHWNRNCVFFCNFSSMMHITSDVRLRRALALFFCLDKFVWFFYSKAETSMGIFKVKCKISRSLIWGVHKMCISLVDRTKTVRDRTAIFERIVGELIWHPSCNRQLVSHELYLL